MLREQGVGSSNLPAPTNDFTDLQNFRSCWRARIDATEVATRREGAAAKATSRSLWLVPATAFLGRLQVAELKQEKHVVDDLEDAADDERERAE